MERRFVAGLSSDFVRPMLRLLSLALALVFATSFLTTVAAFADESASTVDATFAANSTSAADTTSAANSTSAVDTASNVDASSKEVRVGWFFSDDDANSGFAAYSYEYLEAIAQRTGWHYTFVKGTFSECLQWCEEGTVDLLPYTLKTDERARMLDYSNLPEGQEKMYLMTGSTNDRFSYEDYTSFGGMKVAVMEGDMNVSYFEEFAREKGFSVEYVSCSDYQTMFQSVDDGRADAFISGDYQGTGDYKMLAKFGEQPFYFLTTKTRPELIGELDEAMDFIDLSYPDFQSDLLAKYGSYRTQLAELSADEKAYIASNPVITVYLRKDRNPLASLSDDSDTFKGIVPGVLDSIATRSGLHFDYETFDGTSMTQKNAIVVCPYDFSWAAKNGMNLTAPFMTVSIVCVSGPSTSSTRVARLSDDYLTYEVYNSLSSDVSIIDFDSSRECVEAVNGGRVRCVYLSSYEASYYSQIPRYGNLAFQTLDVTQDIAFGVTKDSDPELFSILAKYAGSVDSHVMRALESDSTLTAYKGSWTDAFYESPFIAVGIAIVLAIALMGTIMLTLLYRSKSRQAAAANAAKTEFLSLISHDMRTPMNGIMGMTAMASEQKNPQKTAECLDKIGIASRFLLGLINDVLDVSRAEGGKVSLDPQPYSKEEFTSFIDAVIRPLCFEKGIDFVFDSQLLEDRAPVVDRLKTEQVLTNLISNAVKFTPRGGRVTLKATETLIAEGRMSMDVEVADTGVGIGDEFLPHLFEPFAQESRSDISENRGTGLGLSIVKNIVDLAGGTIEVTSKVGEGSTFVLHTTSNCVPADQVEAHPHEDARDSEAGLKGAQVLLCEDHPLNQEITKALLEKKGMVVTIADDGRIGVDDFAGSAKGFFDIVLMDIRMPVMDGYEATRMIRSLDRSDAKSVPIIALTADVNADDVRKCLDAGMDGHVGKPIDTAVLFETIESFV